MDGRQSAIRNWKILPGVQTRVHTCYLAGVFYIGGAMKRTMVRGTNFNQTQKNSSVVL